MVAVLTTGRRCTRGRLGVDSQFKLLVEHVAGGRRYQPIFCAVRTNKRLSIMTSKKAKSSAETTKAGDYALGKYPGTRHMWVFR